MNVYPDQVLVVDDDPEWQLLLSETISEMGLIGHFASSVSEAEAKLKRRFCHLVIVDLNLKSDELGNRDGMKLLKWLRQTNEGTQSLVVSGYATTRTWREILKSEDAYDVLEKEDVAEIPLKIREGLAIAKRAILSKPFSHGHVVQGLIAAQIQERLEISWDNLSSLIGQLLYYQDTLLEATSIWQISKADKLDPLTLHDIFGNLLAQSTGGRIVGREAQRTLVLECWDRIRERPLMIRMSNQKNILQEHDTYVARQRAFRELGFLKSSVPAILENWGGLLYLTEETERTFSRFESSLNTIRVLC